MSDNTNNTPNDLLVEKPLPTNNAPVKQKFNRRKRKTNAPVRSDHREKRPKDSASFEKRSSAPISTTYPTLTIYEIATSFLNVNNICEIYYSIMQNRDRKFTSCFSSSEFSYIIHLSIYLRCALITTASKTSVIFGLSDLKSLLSDILLPVPMCEYIETFGLIELTSGLKVIPYFRDLTEMCTKPGFIKTRVLYNRINADRRTAMLPEAAHRIYAGQPLDDPNALIICPDVVQRYSNAVSRAYTKAIRVRKVDYSNINGRAEFLTSFEHTADGMTNCFSLEPISIPECQLGAAYGFHFNELTSQFGEGFAFRFECARVDRDIIITNHFNSVLLTE